MTSIRNGWALAFTGGLCMVAGCGGAAPPTQSQTDAVAAVRSADELGSSSTPVAAYQLELARGELTQAEQAMHDGHNEQARDLLERAKADAELAMALRREDQARGTAARAHEQIDQLRTDEGVPTSSPTLVTAPAGTESHTTTTTTVTTAPAAQ